MTYKEFRDNKEIGRLIQFAYDLHKRDFTLLPCLPYFEFYTGHGLYYGKIFKDGGVYGDVFFDNHSNVDALVSLVVMRGFDNNHQNPKSALFIQTTTGKYNSSFYGLYQNPKTGKLSHNFEFDKLTYDEQVNSFIDFIEFLGFKREDILKVINNEMSAREAFLNIAPEELKNRQWVCYRRKFYEFDNNVAVSGDYSGMYIERFPFPFSEPPILDCSKVSTACIHFDSNKNKVKLININSNPDSIIYTDIREAIIDEDIDASLVHIGGTRFGEQRVINLERSLDKYHEGYLDLAYTDNQEDFYNNKIGVMSSFSDIGSLIDNLDNDSSLGIGLVRDESILERYPDIVSFLIKTINYESYYSEDDVIFSKIEDVIYKNISQIYTFCMNKPVIIRLTDIKVDDLSKISNCQISNKELLLYRGADALYCFRELLYSEIRGIIKASKINNKIAYILVPYFDNWSSFMDIKNRILEVAEEEHFNNIKIGAMIENVESAIISDTISESADFISIGTNDLTESVLNKKRSIYDIDFSLLNDDVKKYIKKIVHRVKRKNNIPINICGEHSNHIENLEFYLSLNIDFITCDSSLVLGYQNFINEYNNDSNSYIKKR